MRGVIDGNATAYARGNGGTIAAQRTLSGNGHLEVTIEPVDVTEDRDRGTGGPHYRMLDGPLAGWLIDAADPAMRVVQGIHAPLTHTAAQVDPDYQAPIGGTYGAGSTVSRGAPRMSDLSTPGASPGPRGPNVILHPGQADTAGDIAREF